MSRPVTLSDHMEEIMMKQSLRNSQKLEESKKADWEMDMLRQSMTQSKAKDIEQLEEQLADSQLQTSQAMQQIKELSYSQNATNQTLEALLQHTNKYLVKLSNAVLYLKRDVEMLKKERLENLCECEAYDQCEECEECDECNCCECECCHCTQE